MIRSFLHNSSGLLHNEVNRIRHAYDLHCHRFSKLNARILGVVGILSMTAAFVCVIVAVLYIGYERSEHEVYIFRKIMQTIRIVFILNVIARTLLSYKPQINYSRWFTRVLSIAVLSTIIPIVYPEPEHPWLPFISKILYSNTYLYTILITYSILSLSYGFMRLIGKRTNPAILLSGSFIIFILAGAFVLLLPKCTYDSISFCDSLFVSTSAVCITGLTSVELPTTFTPMGLTVIAVLMQIGGLGVITFTSFFAMFFSGSQSIYSQLLIRDIVYSKTINNLLPTLLYILFFTLAVELMGAVAIYFTIPDELALDLNQKLFLSCFHSLSSFCNAGFSCLPSGMANPALLNSSQSIYLVTSVLVFAGALGFPILVNFKDVIARKIKGVFRFRRRDNLTARPLHIYDLNTKLVLVTTLSILAVSSVSFFILEYNNSLAGMSIGDKAIQSVFNSLTPRSAGFVSLDVNGFATVTLLLVMVQMCIGGSSQSLAGGIKVNTVAVIWLNLKAVLRGNARPNAFDRSISIGSVRRANSVLALAIITFTVYLILIVMIEPGLSLKKIAFEVTSALFTVGSSMGITDQLSSASKFILSSAMFIGRVGLLSMLIGFCRISKDKSEHYPTDDIIIS